MKIQSPPFSLLQSIRDDNRTTVIITALLAIPAAEDPIHISFFPPFLLEGFLPPPSFRISEVFFSRELSLSPFHEPFLHMPAFRSSFNDPFSPSFAAQKASGFFFGDDRELFRDFPTLGLIIPSMFSRSVIPIVPLLLVSSPRWRV